MAKGVNAALDPVDRGKWHQLRQHTSTSDSHCNSVSWFRIRFQFFRGHHYHPIFLPSNMPGKCLINTYEAPIPSSCISCKDSSPSGSLSTKMNSTKCATEYHRDWELLLQPIEGIHNIHFSLNFNFNFNFNFLMSFLWRTFFESQYIALFSSSAWAALPMHHILCSRAAL